MKRLLGILVFLLAWCDATAGEFRTIGETNPSLSRRVYQVDKDAYGFLWMCTQSGIVRYDGSEFRIYELDTPISARDGILSAIRMVHDRDRNVWICLKNGEVYSYDKHMDRFDRRLRLDGVEIRDIMPLDYERILVAATDGFYEYLDGSLNLVGLEGLQVEEVFAGSAGRLFLSTREGVFQCPMSLSQVQPIGGIPSFQVLHVFEWEDKLFIGTFSDGLWIYDFATGKSRPLPFIPKLPVRAICKGSEGEILVGLDGAGVFSIDPAKMQVRERMISSGDSDGSLAGNTVSDICVEDDGTLWVATTTNGLSCRTSTSQGPEWTRHIAGDPSSLDDNHVNVIYMDRDGDLWYGTNHGVNLSAGDSFRHFLGDGDGRVILSITQDRNGQVWAGGYGCGLFWIDKATGRVREVGDSPLRHVYYIFPDGDDVWVGGLEGNFSRYSLSSGKWTQYESDCVGDIWEGPSSETLYLAGCEGLGIFDKKTGSFQWRREFGDYAIASSVRSIYKAQDSSLWLATDGDGLLHWNPESGEAHLYDSTAGLLSESIATIHEDKSGRIWFASEEGLFWLDPSQGTIISVDNLLDTTPGIFNSNSAWLLPDGTLALGTSEGVLRFDPSSLDYFSKMSRKLIFTDFSLDYDKIVPGEGLLPSSIDELSSLNLAYNQNTFSIAFSTISFGGDFRLRYEYRLVEYDTRWRECPPSSEASYVKVPPGRYVFTLRAVDAYSSDVVASRTIAIRIRPPFWRTGWAFALYGVLMAVGAALLVHWLRRRRYRERVADKMRSFISVAHDLKTPVSLIKAPLGDLEGMEGIPESGRSAIQLALRSADRISAMVAELLDLRNMDEEGEDLLLESVELEEFVQGVLDQYKWAVRDKNLEVSLDVSSDMPPVLVDRSKMEHIIGNLLSNALKYTEKGGVDIVARPQEKGWVLEVQDTGIGIPKEEGRRIFEGGFRASNVGEQSGTGIGLMFTRQLVTAHHGTISFSSEEGKGTTFRVSFPYRYKGENVYAPSEAVQGVVDDPAVEPSERHSKETILLVDDEQDMLDYLGDILSDEYEVITARNGGQALEIARGRNPDIVITDMVMPVISGEDLCRILKGSVETSHIPVILLTAISARQRIVFALEAGADDYIIKPFDTQVLRARIRNILQARQTLRESILHSGTSSESEEIDYASRLDKEFMEKVLAVVDREMANPDFKIVDLCMDLAMSRTSFYNKLKSLTGQGPGDFIRSCRLNKANELIRSHRYSIAEVSDMVGFSDPKYFSVCFKKQFGQSPSRL